jgi:GTP-binding protein HflX
VVTLSALTGEGIDLLRELISTTLRGPGDVRRVKLTTGDGSRIAWLHAHGDVLEQNVAGDVMEMEVRLGAADWDRFQSL